MGKVAMVRIPGTIKIVRRGQITRLYIDGAELPWPTSSGSIKVDRLPHELTGVTLTIPADRVELVDEMPESDDD